MSSTHAAAGINRSFEPAGQAEISGSVWLRIWRTTSLVPGQADVSSGITGREQAT